MIRELFPKTLADYVWESSIEVPFALILSEIPVSFCPKVIKLPWTFKLQCISSSDNVFDLLLMIFIYHWLTWVVDRWNKEFIGETLIKPLIRVIIIRHLTINVLPEFLNLLEYLFLFLNNLCLFLSHFCNFVHLRLRFMFLIWWINLLSSLAMLWLKSIDLSMDFHALLAQFF